MLVHDFASLILTSPEIDAKLFIPDRLIDEQREFAPTVIPNFPVRPPHSTSNTPSIPQPFPKRHQFRDPLMRGIALHSFVNHELLALELMALILLRFPKEAQRFRQSLIATMLDEQQHCLMYLDRMKDLGVRYGDLPSNNYFWNELSSVKTIPEFLSGMSLTFEQANLDFSRHYLRIFREVGDEPTAAVLQKVYEDEINHVRSGLAWFRNWKPSNQSEWDYYCQNLPGNLSPARAKGLDFDSEVRKEIGFERDFIDRLEVFSRSKGRHPDLFVFLPDADNEYNDLATKQTKPLQVQNLKSDLSSSLHLLTNDSNAVFVENTPSVQFCRQLMDAGFTVPDFLTESDLLENSKLWKIARVIPWSICPSALSFVSKFADKLTNSTLAATVECAKRVNARTFSSRIEQEMAANASNDRSNTNSYLISTAQEADDALSAIQGIGSKIIVKCNHSSSGQGNRIFHQKPERSSGEFQWIINALLEQKTMVIEPLLDKVMDFSTHYECRESGGVDVLGSTPFLTSPRGQYLGTLVGPKALTTALRALRCIDHSLRPSEILQNMEDTALKCGRELLSNGYFGPASNDAFVHRKVADPQSTLGFRPLVEINARYTMGRLAFALNHRIHSDSAGFVTIINPRSCEKSGFNALSSLADAFATRLPLVCSSEESKKPLRQGTVPLSDPYTSRDFMLILLVGKTLRHIQDVFPEVCRFPDWLLNFDPS